MPWGTLQHTYMHVPPYGGGVESTLQPPAAATSRYDSTHGWSYSRERDGRDRSPWRIHNDELRSSPLSVSLQIVVHQQVPSVTRSCSA
jgi:hypothetical protein